MTETTTFTIDDADAESGIDPHMLHLPEGINWDDKMRDLIKRHDTAFQEASDARVELWDAIEAYRTTVAEDRAAFRKAAIEGGKDPGDVASNKALRAVQFAHERYRAKRQAADRIIGGAGGAAAMNLIKADAVEYLEQALVQAEFYADIYVQTVLETSERFNVAHNNLRTAYRILGWFNDAQDVLHYPTPENPPGADFPQAGAQVAYLKGLRERIEAHLPEIERRQPKVFEDLKLGA